MSIFGFLVYFPFQRSLSRVSKLASLAVLPLLVHVVNSLYFTSDPEQASFALSMLAKSLFYRFREAIT